MITLCSQRRQHASGKTGRPAAMSADSRTAEQFRYSRSDVRGEGVTQRRQGIGGGALHRKRNEHRGSCASSAVWRPYNKRTIPWRRSARTGAKNCMHTSQQTSCRRRQERQSTHIRKSREATLHPPGSSICCADVQSRRSTTLPASNTCRKAQSAQRFPHHGCRTGQPHSHRASTESQAGDLRTSPRSKVRARRCAKLPRSRLAPKCDAGAATQQGPPRRPPRRQSQGQTLSNVDVLSSIDARNVAFKQRFKTSHSVCYYLFSGRHTTPTTL